MIDDVDIMIFTRPSCQFSENAVNTLQGLLGDKWRDPETRDIQGESVTVFIRPVLRKELRLNAALQASNPRNLLNVPLR